MVDAGPKAKEPALPLTAKEADKRLKKELSFTQLLFLSMGGIIGSGWLFAALSGAAFAGPAVIVSWLVGGILVLMVAIVYAEVAGMIPRSGAIVRYPHLTHGSFSGYLLGWTYLLSAVSVPAIEAVAVVDYAATYYPSLLGTTQTTLLGTATVLSAEGIGIALLLLVAFFALNYFGIRLLGRVNAGFTWWKFVIPSLTFVFLFTVMKSSNFSVGGFTPYGWAPVFEAIPLTGIVFSYLGFRQALDFGGEAKNPQRDVPLATILSVVLAVIIYTLLQISFIGAINWGNAGLVAGNWAGLRTSAWASGPFYSALSAAGVGLLGAFGVTLLIDAAISPSGTGWVYLGTSSRTLYGLSADGYFGNLFLRLNKRFSVPWVALLGSLIIGGIFLLPFPSWYLLVGFISSATVFTYVSGGVSLQAFRWRAGHLHRPFRLPFAPILAPIAFLAAMLIVYWSGITLLSLLEVAILLGMPLYVLWYAPTRLGVSDNVSQITGVVFIAGLITAVAYWYTDFYTPFATGSSSLDSLTTAFWGFWGALAAISVFMVVMLYFGQPKESKGRREIWAGSWVLLFLLGLLPFEWYGPFGYASVVTATGAPVYPNTNSLIATMFGFPFDTIWVCIFGLIVYALAVYTSYATEELKALAGEETTTPPEPPTPTGAHLEAEP